MFKGKDISIFVFTYKRIELLKRTLKSVIGQTAKGFEVIVFDNSPEFEAKEIALNFKIKYINTCFSSNFETSKRFMLRKYTIILHDDDLLHPQYIEVCLRALNKLPGLSIISPRHTNCSVNEYPCCGKDVLECSGLLLCHRSVYAAVSKYYCYIWSGTLIESRIYQKAAFNSAYGKISDMPMLFYAFPKRGGKAIVLSDKKAVYYGIHSGQDSKSKINGLSKKQFVAYMKFICKIMSQEGNRLTRMLLLLSLPKMFYTINERFVKDEQPRGFIDSFIDTCKWNRAERIYLKRYNNPFYWIIGLVLRVFCLLMIHNYLKRHKVNF